jgi:hypothetical protein
VNEKEITARKRRPQVAQELDMLGRYRARQFVQQLGRIVLL